MVFHHLAHQLKNLGDLPALFSSLGDEIEVKWDVAIELLAYFRYRGKEPGVGDEELRIERISMSHEIRVERINYWNILRIVGFDLSRPRVPAL